MVYSIIVASRWVSGHSGNLIKLTIMTILKRSFGFKCIKCMIGNFFMYFLCTTSARMVFLFTSQGRADWLLGVAQDVITTKPMTSLTTGISRSIAGRVSS